jgi:Domain of unknown function (DUF4157)
MFAPKSRIATMTGNRSAKEKPAHNRPTQIQAQSISKLTADRPAHNNTGPGVSWDFSKVAIDPPNRISGAQALSPFRRPNPARLSTLEQQEQFAEERFRGYAGRSPGKTPLFDPPSADSGRGAPMSQALRSIMRPSFNASVDNVRIHADAKATNTVRNLGAEAFTFGRDIYLDPDRYRAAGPALVAHELTHVGQQMATGMPMLQPKVRFTGSPTALDKVIAIINASLDFRLQAKLNSAGDLSIGQKTFNIGGQDLPLQGPPTRMQSEFTTRLESVINESGLVTEGVIESGVPLVGSWALRQIDVDDMNALGVDKPGWNAGASLIHELTEQREGQVGGETDFNKAHATATTAENAVIGAVQESDTGAMTPTGGGKVSGTRTTVLRYPDGTRWKMVVTVVDSNITKVDRVQLP